MISSECLSPADPVAVASVGIVAPVPVDVPPLRPRPRSRWIWLLASLTVLGFLVRLAISCISLGSNDQESFRWFGALAITTGPFAYHLEPVLNHPPIPLVWAAMALLLSVPTDGAAFPFLFRLPAIFADVGSCILLYRIWTARGGNPVWGWLAATALAWNLDAILIGAYHCNTDNLCAFLTLLCAYLLSGGRSAEGRSAEATPRPLAGGLALAAAINVKLVPILLIPVFFAVAITPNAGNRWRSAARFALGLSVGVIPFLFPLALVPAAFIRNVLAYNPAPGEWGIMFFAMHLPELAIAPAGAHRFAEAYVIHGRFLVLGAALAVGVLALAWRWRHQKIRAATTQRMPDAYTLGALAWALFLVLTPGFGYQYTVYAVPLLMAVSIRFGWTYGLVAGLFVLSAYAGCWTNWRLPLESRFDGTRRPNPFPVPLGLVAWAMLIAFVVNTVIARIRRAR
jgi:hypothetical protein